MGAFTDHSWCSNEEPLPLFNFLPGFYPASVWDISWSCCCWCGAWGPRSGQRLYSRIPAFSKENPNTIIQEQKKLFLQPILPLQTAASLLQPLHQTKCTLLLFQQLHIQRQEICTKAGCCRN